MFHLGPGTINLGYSVLLVFKVFLRQKSSTKVVVVLELKSWSRCHVVKLEAVRQSKNCLIVTRRLHRHLTSGKLMALLVLEP